MPLFNTHLTLSLTTMIVYLVKTNKFNFFIASPNYEFTTNSTEKVELRVNL